MNSAMNNRQIFTFLSGIYVDDKEKQRELYDRLENISVNVEIDDNGILRTK